MVPKMVVFPVRTSAQASHSIRCALANSLKMPVSRNRTSSLEALFTASVSLYHSLMFLLMQYGMGRGTEQGVQHWLEKNKLI